jgi:5'-3' exonuclease
MHLLIDSDSLMYRAGFSAEYTLYNLSKDGEVKTTKYKREVKALEAEGWKQTKKRHVIEPIENCIGGLKRSLIEIIDEIKADDITVVISDLDNWRYDLYQDYKANRVAPKPYYYEQMRSYLKNTWNALSEPYLEADDLVADIANEDPMNTIIAGIDKDLLQIPTWHYNWTNKKVRKITPIQGEYNFYTQMLQGDRGDNIPGVYKVGSSGAALRLNDCDTTEDMWWAVLCTYEDKDPTPYNEIVLRGQMLRLGSELWHPPEV